MSAYYYDVTKPLFIGSTLLSAYISGSPLHLPALTLSHPDEPPGHIATDSRSGILTKLNSTSDRAALRAWWQMYESGRDTNPPLAVASALCSFAAAYTHYHPQAAYRSYMFVAAGVATLAIAPWTWLVMVPTNNELYAEMQAAEPAGERGDKRSAKVTGLLETWRTMNWARAALPLIGAFCAMEAL